MSEREAVKCEKWLKGKDRVRKWMWVKQEGKEEKLEIKTELEYENVERRKGGKTLTETLDREWVYDSVNITNERERVCWCVALLPHSSRSDPERRFSLCSLTMPKILLVDLTVNLDVDECVIWCLVCFPASPQCSQDRLRLLSRMQYLLKIKECVQEAWVSHQSFV